MVRRDSRAVVACLAALLLVACTTAREVKSSAVVDFASLARRAELLHGEYVAAYREGRITRASAVKFDAWWAGYKPRQQALHDRLQLARTDDLEAIHADIRALRVELDGWVLTP